MDTIRIEKTFHEDENFQNLWPVTDKYRIEGNVIKQYGKPQKLYAPIECKNLPNEFAMLCEEPNNEEIINFLRTYGLLGRGLLNAQYTSIGNQNNVVTKNIVETTDWVITHSKTVKTILDLSYYIQEYKYGELKKYLIEYACGKNSTAIQLEIGNLEDTEKITIPFDFCDDEIETSVRRLCAELISENIQNIHRLVYVDKKGCLQSTFVFTALIEIIYWILADSILKGELKQCMWCKRFFIQTHGNQKYCPIPTDVKEKYPKVKDSRCGSAYRVSEFRKNKKQDITCH